MTSKEAGHKAHETRVAKFGPNEQRRAKQQADWTRQNGHSAENPYLRERVYTEAEQKRSKQFEAWQKENVGRSIWENPFRYSR